MASDLYTYYREALAGTRFPVAFVDLDRFDANAAGLVARAGSKQLRVASKSVRCRALLQRVLAGNPAYNGLMTYHARETAWLARQGFSDLLLAYPPYNRQDLDELAKAVRETSARIRIMTDLPAHLDRLNEVGQRKGVVFQVCVDLDLSIDFPGIHFGVRRSSQTTPVGVRKFAEYAAGLSNVTLDALMGYEAQIAGLGDAVPGQWMKNRIIRLLKQRSIPKIAARRAAAVQALTEVNGNPPALVNAGGTGSLESSRQETAVTEITVGSGLYSSGLFDHYANFRHQPAAGFAVEITRQPAPDILTALGGGYTASGPPGPDKAVRLWLPEGLRFTPNEWAGEVQTPVRVAEKHRLKLGDPLFLRHAKAGELCERFNTLLLIHNGAVVDEVPTYRGEGQCFL